MASGVRDSRTKYKGRAWRLDGTLISLNNSLYLPTYYTVRLAVYVWDNAVSVDIKNVIDIYYVLLHTSLFCSDAR